MRRLSVLVLVLAAAHRVAAAQPVPPTFTGKTYDPTMTIGLSGQIWIPQGDADDFADTSIGFRPHFAYSLKPWVAGVAAIDYTLVNEKGDGDVTYYSFSAGARFIVPRLDQIEPYGELLVGWHKFETDGGD